MNEEEIKCKYELCIHYGEEDEPFKCSKFNCIRHDYNADMYESKIFTKDK